MINKKIGERIKETRNSWGLSQLELAERVGISFQQIQKYEKGATKISVMRLQQIAKALGVDILYFFIGSEDGVKITDASPTYSPKGKDHNKLHPLNKEEILLLKLFRKIRNKKLRESVLNQLRGIIELEKKK